MVRHFIVAAFLTFAFCFPADSGRRTSQANGRHGSWDTSSRPTSSRMARVVSGVAYIFGPDGHKVTYHFNGHFQNGRLQAGS